MTSPEVSRFYWLPESEISWIEECQDVHLLSRISKFRVWSCLLEQNAKLQFGTTNRSHLSGREPSDIKLGLELLAHAVFDIDDQDFGMTHKYNESVMNAWPEEWDRLDVHGIPREMRNLPTRGEKRKRDPRYLGIYRRNIWQNASQVDDDVILDHAVEKVE
jgi:hypothetical protein